jgi:hypothetical protein
MVEQGNPIGICVLSVSFVEFLGGRNSTGIAIISMVHIVHGKYNYKNFAIILREKNVPNLY